jgi:hypothetical protein
VAEPRIVALTTSDPRVQCHIDRVYNFGAGCYDVSPIQAFIPPSQSLSFSQYQVTTWQLYTAQQMSWNPSLCHLECARCLSASTKHNREHFIFGSCCPRHSSGGVIVWLTTGWRRLADHWPLATAGAGCGAGPG